MHGVGVCARVQGVDVPLFVTADGRSYDAHKQWSIYCESQAAWYLTVILCQFWCGAAKLLRARMRVRLC